MQVISQKQVDRIWGEVESLSPEELGERMGRMGEEQQIIMAFLFEVSQVGFSKLESQLLFNLAFMVHQIMRQGDAPIPEVEVAQVEGALEANFGLLESFEELSEEEISAAFQEMLTQYNQKPLFEALAEAIMGTEDDQVAPEHKGVMLMYVKSIVDCFDR